jgi:acyl-coenzyme A synthetase/AMP-(fatty) acid ligase
MRRSGSSSTGPVRVDGVAEAIAIAGCSLTAGGATWTGAQLAGAAARMAGALRGQGVRPGESIGWAAQGSAGGAEPEVVAELACLTLGAAAAPMPPDALANPPLRLNHLIDLSAGVEGIGQRTFPTAWRPAVQSVPHAEAESLVGVKFTSGTTGPRKAVGVTAAHLEHTWAGLDSVFGIGAGDVVLAPLEPHVWLQRTVVLLALARGAHVVLAPDPRRLVNALRSARPTVVFGVPSVLAAVLEAARRTGRPLDELWGGRLRSLGTGSAPCPAEVIAAYQQAGVPVHEGYGTSETGMIAKNGPGRSRPGTVGPAFPGVTLDLLDGVVRVRCAALPPPRYLDGTPIEGRESATTHLTRDLGRFDDDGYLSLLGRVDDVITLASGRKVHPQLLEEQLRAVPGVADCAVFADERQQLRAVVVPAPGTPAEQVREALRARGAGVPVDAWPVPAVLGSEARLPRTAQGKLLRRELLRLFRDGLL